MAALETIGHISRTIAIEALRTERVRSVLGVTGIVLGIVTVVLVASILANARNQVALRSAIWAPTTCSPSI